MQKIVTYLWFNDQAEEAVKFYTSIFPNSSVKQIGRYGDAGPGPKGSVMSIAFELDGQDFFALNGGPAFSFTPAISLLVNCFDQAEVDLLWEKMSAGGSKGQCGWLTDKYGLSWQIIPTILSQMLLDPDEARSQRVMKAMLAMGKIDIADLEKAYEG